MAPLLRLVGIGKRYGASPPPGRVRASFDGVAGQAFGAFLAEGVELILTGEDRIPAAEALRIGLVNRVVPRDELDDATMALADEIAKNEPFVVRAMKASINRAWQLAGLRAALDANTELDVMIETANLPARDEFRRITQEEGLKAAIAWRDARYRSGG